MKLELGDKPRCHRSDWPDKWPVWVKDLAVEFTLAEYDAATDLFLPDSAPEWVFGIGKKLVKMYAPTASLNRRSKRSGAYVLGAFIGHQMSLFEDEERLEVLVEQYTEASRILNKRLRLLAKRKKIKLIRKKVSEDRSKYLLAIHSFSTTIDRKAELTKKAVAVACGQPLQDATDFFYGFSTALERRTLAEDGHLSGETEAFYIYVQMFLRWRVVQKFQSVTELYNWLCLTVGTQKVRNLERVKKICLRHKIKFRPPGHPKKGGGGFGR